MTLCPNCKKEVEFEDTDEVTYCEVCGEHYLDKCPECRALVDLTLPNPQVVHVPEDKTK